MAQVKNPTATRALYILLLFFRGLSYKKFLNYSKYLALHYNFKSGGGGVASPPYPLNPQTLANNRKYANFRNSGSKILYLGL